MKKTFVRENTHALTTSFLMKEGLYSSPKGREGVSLQNLKSELVPQERNLTTKGSASYVDVLIKGMMSLSSLVEMGSERQLDGYAKLIFKMNCMIFRMDEQI